jgi:hypothetical protein
MEIRENPGLGHCRAGGILGTRFFFLLKIGVME